MNIMTHLGHVRPVHLGDLLGDLAEGQVKQGDVHRGGAERQLVSTPIHGLHECT